MRGQWPKWAAGLALIAGLVLLRQPAASGLVWLAEWVDGLGRWAPAAFTAALTLAVPLCLPLVPFLLASGVLFGAVGGVVYGALGNLLGGGLAFLLGRRWLRGPVERRLASEVGLEVMNRALRQEGVRGIALLRLSPVLPAALINYALGVSRVSWRRYWLSSPTVLPNAVLYALSGVGLGELAAIERGAGPSRDVGYYALLGTGIVATLIATVLLSRRARRVLEELEE